MGFGFLCVVLLQTAASLGIIYGFYRERDVVRLENALWEALCRARRRRKKRRERRRIRRLNARAVYRPRPLPDAEESTKAA